MAAEDGRRENWDLAWKLREEKSSLSEQHRKPVHSKSAVDSAKRL